MGSMCTLLMHVMGVTKFQTTKWRHNIQTTKGGGRIKVHATNGGGAIPNSWVGRNMSAGGYHMHRVREAMNGMDLGKQ